MAEHPPQESPPRKRRIRSRVLLLAIPFLVLVVGWKVVESYIDIERYRPLINKELELLIELPLEFGAMDLQLFPTPRLVVENVALGEDDFMAFSPEVAVTADLGKLIHKELELHVVSIQDLRVQLPVEETILRQRWSDYMLALDTPDPSTGKPMLKVSLDRIVANDAQVFRGETPYATGRLEVRDVTSGAPVFTFSADGTGIAGQPGASGEFTLTVDKDPLLQGTAKVSRLPLANLTGVQTIQPFVLDGVLEYQQALDDPWTFSAAGDLSLPDSSGPLGTFSLDAGYSAGDLVFEQIQILSEPIQFQGDLALLQNGSWDLAIDSAVLKDSGITWLGTWLPELPFLDNPTVPSRGTLTNMRMGESDANGFTISAGTIAVQGVDLGLDTAYVLPEIQGQANVSENVFEILALSSCHLDVTGAIQTRFDSGSVVLDLTGLIQLRPDFPLPEALASDYRAEHGDIVLRELHAELPGGYLDLPSLRIDTVISNGSISAWDESASSFEPIPDVSGHITVRSGEVKIAELNSAFSVLSATLIPDVTLDRWTFDGILKSDLASPIWKPFFRRSGVAVTTGSLECSRLSGTLVAGNYTPEALEVEASVKSFNASLDMSGFQDQLNFDAISIAATNEQCDVTIDGATDNFGPLRGSVKWTFLSGDAGGTVTLNPVRATGLPASFREGTAGALLERLSPLPLELSYSNASGLLNFSASEPIPFSGNISRPRELQTRAPFGLSISASIPGDWLTPIVPGTKISGAVSLQCQLNASDGNIDVAMDATTADATWQFVNKSAGLTAKGSLAGQWGQDGPAFSSGRIEVAEIALPLVIDEYGVACDAFSVDLASLSPLLPDSASAIGTIRGSFTGNLQTVALTLDETSFSANEDCPVVRADGRVLRNTNGWALESLTWGVGSSSGTAEIQQTENTWSGVIEASHLSITDLYKAYDAFTNDENKAAKSDAEEKAKVSVKAEIQITAKTLDWADATVERVRGILESSDTGVALRSISFLHGAGAGAGELVYRPAARNTVGTVDADVQLLDVDASLIEDLFMSDTRGLEGQLNGTATLQFPLPEGDASVLNGMNGQIRFEALNGTLGKAGLASKLLTALRTTDILRLRIPLLRDRGLTFNTLSGTIEIESGVFQLAPFAMADSTYTLEAECRFDFPQNLADGNVQVQVLEGVTGVTRKIPILGDAAGIVSKMLGVPIKITGTATDPTFRVSMPGQ